MRTFKIRNSKLGIWNIESGKSTQNWELGIKIEKLGIRNLNEKLGVQNLNEKLKIRNSKLGIWNIESGM